ncbi:MAG: flagellar biosynthesis protein FlgF [Gammaproteobacteria bacterium HGW-Gammaproteobacteria-3]|nr:MAG: flagellar biosynthesis protein FlgF [Gammaproteobacteria bacterium HGW-Gammaproteobacteria-3]
MDRGLYIAMSGAKQNLLAQAANVNNLANANTTGFKADMEQFRSMPVFGPGFPTRIYAMTERPGVNLAQGQLYTTGRELDVAVNGEGFIAVAGQNGQEAYTRAGELRATPTGQLQTGAGLPVLGNNGPIVIPPAQKLTIGQDGTISIIPLGSNATNTAVIDRIKLVNPPLKNLEKHLDGELYLKDAAAIAPDANVALVQGALEGSNANPIAGMAEMIELARNFELQTKVMQQIDENSGVSARLMQMQTA